MATPGAQPLRIDSVLAPPAWIIGLPSCQLKTELGKVLAASSSLPMIEESWEDITTLFLPLVPRPLNDIIFDAILDFDGALLQSLKTADNQSDEAEPDDDDYDNDDDDDDDEGQAEDEDEADEDDNDGQECLIQACIFLDLVRIGQTF